MMFGDYSGWVKMTISASNLSQKCYAVLKDENLTFYTDESAKEIFKAIVLSTDSKFNRAGTKIVITMAETTLTFMLESNEDAINWFDSLQIATCLPGSTLSMDDFRIISVIGRGFYGKVMLCEKIDTSELCAIKTVHKDQLIQSNRCHTIISERNVLIRANHPFIVKLKFAFQTKAKFYLGLEYVSGGELFYHMERRRTIPIDEARLYVAEIALALDYLHSIGVIYRDLKPENILLDAEGHIKFTDFGLAKDLANESSTRTICGTSEYMAPELVCNMPYSYEVDWWALGILFYEMLTENTPFYSQNKHRMLDAIMHSSPCLGAVGDDQAASLIKELLVKDPKKRLSFTGIKAHPFFKDIDWEKVYMKEYKPLFVPPAARDAQCPVNFDQEFTREKAADSYVTPASADFPGFSFTAVPTGSEGAVFADD